MYQTADAVAEIDKCAVRLNGLYLAFQDCTNLKRIDTSLLLLASLDLGCLSAGQDQTLLLSVCCDV